MTTIDLTNDVARFIRACARCGQRYDWRRSPSGSLKMTYCGSLCERADLGFTIEALLRVERGEPAVIEPIPARSEMQLILAA